MRGLPDNDSDGRGDTGDDSSCAARAFKQVVVLNSAAAAAATYLTSILVGMQELCSQGSAL